MLTIRQVAKRCNVSESLVYAWTQSGILPSYRFGREGKRGRVMVDENELEGFIAGMKAPARAEEAPALRHVNMKARHG